MPVRASGSQPCSVPTPMRTTAIISTWISPSGAINRIIADDRAHWQRKRVWLFRRINATNWRPTSGIPGLPAPVPMKARRCQRTTLGPDDRDGLEDREKPSIQLDEEQAIGVRQHGR